MGKVSIHQIAVAVFAVFVCHSFAFISHERECLRHSPEEIWYTDYGPWINSTTLEELRVYYRIIFGRLEDGNLFALAPHIKDEPEKARELEEKMSGALSRALATLPRSMKIMENAFVKVGEQGRLLNDGKLSKEEAFQLLDELLNGFHRANKVLMSGGKEVADFFKMMLEIVIDGVSQILETELEEAPEGDAAVLKLIQNKMLQMAPDNLLGVIARRFIGRGLGTVTTSPSKEKPNVLFQAIPRIEKIVSEFKKDFERDPLTMEAWNQFWERMLNSSIGAMRQREAEGKEDYVLIYRNEIYLAEVLMNIMTVY